MITTSNLSASTVQLKRCVLLMDSNPERRALRRKIMALHGVEMIGAGDLGEAASIWHRDRYDMVLIDIRKDHGGALALRDEIKKESPGQVVAFLVGKPDYVSLDPAPGSYVPEQHGAEWGEAMRTAMKQGCESLPQRNGFVEAGFRIASAKRRNGLQVQAAAVEDPLPTSRDTDPVEKAG
jgi:hypothetical protein